MRMREERSAWIPKGAAFKFGREKGKGKKGERTVGPDEDCMRDLYRTGPTPSRILSRRTKRSERALFASYAGGIMGVPTKGNRRIYLPN